MCAMPQKIEATTKIATQTWKIILRPNRSPSLPASAVAIVSASRYAVTTQDRWVAPPRSPTMVGNAVPTIVWSSAASSMPNAMTSKIALRRPGLNEGGPVAATSAVATVMLR